MGFHTGCSGWCVLSIRGGGHLKGDSHMRSMGRDDSSFPEDQLKPDAHVNGITALLHVDEEAVEGLLKGKT